MLRVKLVVLYIAKGLGLFSLCRRVTANGIRILCYHGFSYADEHLFRRQLFITPDAFLKRLDRITEMGFNVISLDHAVKNIMAGKELRSCLVITVDDGWQGTEDIAMPLLESHGFNWTLYLTSYYSEKQTQIMNVVLQYMCWKTQRKLLDISSLDSHATDVLRFGTGSDRERAAIRLIEIGNTKQTAETRQAFVRSVAAALQIDQKALEGKRMFHIVSEASVKRMSAKGVDIQLHTHRHTLHGIDHSALAREILDNRAFISRATGHNPSHFCYPSGFYDKKHHQWLIENGVVSATTCKPGLNYRDTPLLELNRFLDGDNISLIEFEAELAGVLEVARRVRAKFNDMKRFSLFNPRGRVGGL